MSKKKIAIIASIVVVLFLLIGGITYAYYSANVKENNKTQTVIKTNELEIVYTGTQEINVSGIVPGDSFAKTFTVENNSNVPVTYNIYLENITNEFNEDLVYTLKDKDGTVIQEEVLPSTSDKTYLITDIEIDASELKEYEMTVEFKYSDEDQNKLQGKMFNATLGVDTKKVSIVKVVNDKLELDKLNSGDTVTKTFSVKNLSNETQSYDLKLSDIASTYGDNLTYSLSKNGEEVVSNEVMPTSDEVILEGQTIASKSSDEYTMTIKFDNRAAALEYIIAEENDKFSANITTESEEMYSEALLNGADPVLNNNLVPILLSDDGTVTKADTKEKWYNYENKQWANAVILTEEDTYEVGDKIEESAIESYFVWIPRYKYKIFNDELYTSYIESKPTESKAKEIEIVFENKNTTVSTTDTWLTHPAFIAFDTNGLWVGKFELTGSIDDLTVKPGKKSVRSQTVSSLWEAMYNYDRTNESHMMKNTEWGAVAYLSHSKYGINAEVRINNNSDYLTGYSAVDTADQSSYPGTYGTDSSVTLAYNTTTGYKASTTGNITGIYDMSGGAYEYMASYLTGYGAVSSGFTSDPVSQKGSKYFDVYTNSADKYNNYAGRILGDATGEMGPFYYYQEDNDTNYVHNSWYGDHSYFVGSSFPWFSRGGFYNSGVLAGQFYFARNTGGSHSAFSSRLVLAD